MMLAQAPSHLSSDVYFQLLSGRTQPTYVPTMFASLWICLRGRIEIDSLEGPFELVRGDCLTLPSDAAPAAVSSLRGLGAALALPLRSLGIQRRGPSGRARTQVIFAHRSAATRELLRDTLAALRRGAHWDESTRHFHALRMMQSVLADQHEIRTWLQRVPGRSEAHRRGALQRLIRARNAILNMPFENHDLESLALASSYSKSHFLRTFRDVFGETPCTMLAATRVAMAKCLMFEGQLGIGEIAADVGYGSRCAFSRMFKARVGVSASHFRRMLGASLDMSANEAGLEDRNARAHLIHASPLALQRA